MTFVNNGTVTVTQPTTMLSDINELTDTNQATTASNVCQSSQDLIVDYSASCTTGYTVVITSTSTSATTNTGSKTCIVLPDLTYDWFTTRYTTSSTACTNALLNINWYFSYVNTVYDRSSSSGTLATAYTNLNAYITQNTDADTQLDTYNTNVYDLSVAVQELETIQSSDDDISLA